MKDYKLHLVNTERLLTLANWLKENSIDLHQLEIIGSDEPLTKSRLAKFTMLVKPIIALPIVFPDLWIYNEDNDIVYVKDKSQQTFISVVLCFGLHPGIFRHLFIPYSQHESKKIFGGKVLSNLDSTNDVAEQIFAFLASYQKL